MRILPESISSHLAGRKSGEIKNAIFSPFFALKSLKKRFIFYCVFTSKTMQKCNFFKKVLRFCHNILQVNTLRHALDFREVLSDLSEQQRNLLTCKILTDNCREIKEKCKKRIDFSLIF